MVSVWALPALTEVGLPRRAAVAHALTGLWEAVAGAGESPCQSPLRTHLMQGERHEVNAGQRSQQLSQGKNTNPKSQNDHDTYGTS